MYLLNSLLFLVSLVCVAYRYFTRNFNYWKNKNVVGPNPTVLFGNVFESVFRRKNQGIIFKEIYDSYPEEKIVGVYRMTTSCLLIRDLDIIKHVMVKDFDIFTDRGMDFSKEGLGSNLFHADGDTWRVLRNKFSPLFTSTKLKNMIHLMTERGDMFVDHLEFVCHNKPEQEVHELFQKYTIASISACAFGVDIDNIPDKLELLKNVDKLVFTTSFFREVDMMYPGILKKINISLFSASIIKLFHELTTDVINLRKGVPSSRNDFIDLILEMRKHGELHASKRNDYSVALKLELTADVIAAQVFIFFVAGYETGATTMAFLLYQLALNPDIQDKVIAEIDEVLKKHDGKVTYDSLMDMPYLDKVFSETLRMYPIVEPLQRNARTNYTIPGTNVTIHDGLKVLISPMGIHHDEKYYPNPDIFDPERFSPQQTSGRHSCAYLPFGIGPRNCIGMRFAKIQSRICITKMLSKYNIRPSKRTPKKIEFDPRRTIIGPNGGIHLNIVRRT